MKRLNRQEAFRGSNSRPMISYDRTEFPRGKWFSATSERNFHKKSGVKLRLSGISMKTEASGFQQRRNRISMRIEKIYKRHFYTKPRDIKNKIIKRDATKAKAKAKATLVTIYLWCRKKTSFILLLHPVAAFAFR